MSAPLEIERKWMVSGWPEVEFPLLKNEFMQQGYVSTLPTVRIREETSLDGSTRYMLCFKSHGQIGRAHV